MIFWLSLAQTPQNRIINMLSTVVIVGRRNVGKSALFNRLIEKDKAIVSEIAGTTRDRTEGICRWRGRDLRVIDTGGLDIGNKDGLDREIKKQAHFAIDQADLVIFLVDARVGPQPADKQLAQELQKIQTKVVLAANKAETKELRFAAQNPAWKRLGFDLPLSISALTGQGVGDLLDEIFKQLNPSSEKVESKVDLKVSIVGKPNVGKSSLLNKILGEERVIVSPIPHTTREPQDTLFTIEAVPPSDRRSGLPISNQQTHILLIDTAGIRRRAKITPGIEQAGISKTLAIIERSDVVLFIIDGTEPLDAQDKRLAGLLEEKNVGVIVVVNKWDRLPRADVKSGDELKSTVRHWLPGLDFAEVVFVSALTGHNVQKVLPAAMAVQENRKRVIPEAELAELLPKLVKRHKPTRGRGNTKYPVIRRIEQVGSQPPTFVAWIGSKQSLHQTYLRFIENQLRTYFDFEGTPIRVEARQEKK